MIDAEGVDVRLGDVSALESVDLSVEEGRLVGLVGPNGAGKSTLLRTIAATLEPDAGRVLIDGEDVHALSSKAASRRVATVPQNTNLSFDFDVRAVVEMGRTPYASRFRNADRDGRRAVEWALERTRTLEFADRSISEVSGGERQRVLLARALAQDTPVLLLDEPTASLDINHQVRTFELVDDLVDEGKTVVAAIHDLNLAAHYCDELVLLADGRVLDAGPPESVLTAETLDRAFGARAVVDRHPVTGSVYVTTLPDRPAPDRGRIHVIGGGGSASRLLYVLSAAGYDVSVGALDRGDSDLRTAELLGLEAITLPPFAPVDADARRRVERAVRSADAAVVADVEVGAGNVANLECALESDALVLVEERPFAERNYAGDDAARVYRRLRDRARIASEDRILRAVERTLETPAPRS